MVWSLEGSLWQLVEEMTPEELAALQPQLREKEEEQDKYLTLDPATPPPYLLGELHQF